jgi:hypothetical protein
MKPTIPPSAQEKREQEQFLRDLKERGEKEARLSHFAKKHSSDSDAKMAIWAAILGGIGGVALIFRKKKDPIVEMGKEMGL